MTYKSCFPRVVVAWSLALAAQAQATASDLPARPGSNPGSGPGAERMVVVTRAAAGEVVRSARSHQRGCVVDASGRIWVLVRRSRAGDGGSSAIELHVSTDLGRSFRVGGRASGSAIGGLALGPGPTELQVCWSRPGRAGSDAVYRAFDRERMDWLGRGVSVLATASSRNDQYRSEGVAVTPSGKVFVAISSQRGTPRKGGWRGSWSTALRERTQPAADGEGLAEFGPVLQVNVGSYGVAPDLTVHGSVLHLSYRSQGTAGHGIWARRFDHEQGRFLDPKEIAVSARSVRGPSGLLEAGNPSALTADLDGARYVAFYSGSNRPGSGRIEIGHASARGAKFSRLFVADDPALVGGNTNEQHVSLASGPGDHVEVVFSKRSEQHRRLWRRVYSAGQPLGPAQVVAEAATKGAFEQVSGVRCVDPAASSVRAVVSGPTKAAAHGRVGLYGLTWPARVRR